ncbi:MAG: hypothetical protein M0Z62_03040 [Actinomycetota bacterium]|nr:hypothetical protein [Actinomycetota bacterium]
MSSVPGIGTGSPGLETPLRHDSATITCPVCARRFEPVGRQRYCCDACRSAAYRRRRDSGPLTLPIATIRSRRAITVYECGTCGGRALGEQYCVECSRFMHKVGVGGECPQCSEPLAVTEVLPEELTAPAERSGRAKSGQIA